MRLAEVMKTPSSTLQLTLDFAPPGGVRQPSGVEVGIDRNVFAEAEIDGVRRTRHLASLRYDLELPPEDQFRHLAAPTRSSTGRRA